MRKSKLFKKFLAVTLAGATLCQSNFASCVESTATANETSKSSESSTLTKALGSSLGVLGAAFLAVGIHDIFNSKKLSRENHKLASNNSDLRRLNINLRINNDGLRSENGDLRQENGRLSSLNDHLFGTAAAWRARQIAEFEAEKHALVSENDHLKAENDHLEQQNAEIRACSSLLEAENRVLKQDRDYAELIATTARGKLGRQSVLIARMTANRALDTRRLPDKSDLTPYALALAVNQTEKRLDSFARKIEDLAKTNPGLQKYIQSLQLHLRRNSESSMHWDILNMLDLLLYRDIFDIRWKKDMTSLFNPISGDYDEAENNEITLIVFNISLELLKHLTDTNNAEDKKFLYKEIMIKSNLLTKVRELLPSVDVGNLLNI